VNVEQEAALAPDPAPSTQDSLRVVVVDDHPMAREWTRASLEEAEGISVVGVAETGAAGLHLVADRGPDVLVLDIHLPDMSGIEIARRVRAALPQVQIVVITGFDDTSYVQALLQLGVRAYLTKSASAAEIVQAVREAAAGRTTVRSDAARSLTDTGQALSSRDRQLLGFLASGRSNVEIAEALDVSLNVVEYRIGQLLQTLGARSRAEAIQRAVALGLVTTTSFVRGLPAMPALKRYHGSRSASGKYTVQVQEGAEFRLLVHDCLARNLPGCLSSAGWSHGFSAFGGIELARWLLADCLGEEFLNQRELCYLFKSSLLVNLPPTEWMISEAEIRGWAGEQGITGAGVSEAPAA
jgi:DNA-binding NarL/FixJ family response regulator